MATTYESADKSAVSKVFKCGKIRGHHTIVVLQLQHLPIPAYFMFGQVKSLSIKVFGVVNDCTDINFILNVQSCRLHYGSRDSMPGHANLLRKHIE